MFGLMKSCTCLQTSDQRHHRRLHYCGTCKTIGGLYGWKSRLLLNSDGVFLGEVLSALSGADEALDRWHRAYQSYSCFSSPDAPADMPISLQYAAAATLINAQFKIADQITDSKCSLWHLPRWCLSRSFRAASERLKLWGFPLANLWACAALQAKREADAAKNPSGNTPDRVLAGLAESTAIAAGLFFQHGAEIVGNPSAGEAMGALGRTFGALIYTLDALEDYERDFRRGQFNALRAAYRLSGKTLPAQVRQSVTRTIRGLAGQIENILTRLPIAATRAAQFAVRLQANLSIRLDGKRMSQGMCRALPRQAISLRERLQAASTIGRSMAGKYLPARPSLIHRLRASLVFVSAASAGFLLPRQAGTASSYRECMELASNLMLLGSAFRPAMATSQSFSVPTGPDLPGDPGGPGLPDPQQLGKKPDDKGSSCCDGCDCCCSCPCDACSCGDCGDCSCCDCN